MAHKFVITLVIAACSSFVGAYPLNYDFVSSPSIVYQQSSPVALQSGAVSYQTSSVAYQANPLISNPIISSANSIISSANPIISSANPIISSVNPIISSGNPIISSFPANGIVSTIQPNPVIIQASQPSIITTNGLNTPFVQDLGFVNGLSNGIIGASPSNVISNVNNVNNLGNGGNLPYVNNIVLNDNNNNIQTTNYQNPGAGYISI